MCFPALQVHVALDGSGEEKVGDMNQFRERYEKHSGNDLIVASYH